jgi:hypothetical protein
MTTPPKSLDRMTSAVHLYCNAAARGALLVIGQLVFGPIHFDPTSYVLRAHGSNTRDRGCRHCLPASLICLWET